MPYKIFAKYNNTEICILIVYYVKRVIKSKLRNENYKQHIAYKWMNYI